MSVIESPIVAVQRLVESLRDFSESTFPVREIVINDDAYDRLLAYFPGVIVSEGCMLIHGVRVYGKTAHSRKIAVESASLGSNA